MLRMERTKKYTGAVSQMNDSIGWNFIYRLRYADMIQEERQREALVNLTQGQEEEDKKKHNAILKALYKPVEKK